MQIITDPLFYVLAVPAVFMLGLSKGGFSGVGQSALPLMALVMAPLEAAAIMLPISILQDGSALWVYRKTWNGRVLAIVLPAAVVGIIIAGLLAAHISEAAVRLFLGVSAFIFVLYSWIGAARIAKEADKEFGKPNILSGIFWGVLSGFTSTIAQAGSMPYQMYVMRLRMAKLVFVGTNAIFFAVVNVLKIFPYAALGQFTAKGLATSAVLFPLAIATNQLGFWLVRRVSTETFYKLMLVLMFLLSLELMRAGVMGVLRT